MDKETLKGMLIDSGAVQFGKFVLASGQESDYYINMKKAMTDPAILEAIAIAGADLVEDADRLAGMELGAIPIVVAMSLETGLPYVMIRKEKKGHGTGRRIEGDIAKGEKVVMVEDVTTTGMSTINAAEAVIEAGGVVERVIVVVDRQEGAAENMRDRGFEFIPILTRDDLRS